MTIEAIRAAIATERGGWDTAPDESVLHMWRSLTNADRERMIEAAHAAKLGDEESADNADTDRA